MALDAVAKLRDEIAAAFSENLRKDAFIQDFLEKAKQKNGALTQEDVQKFSERLGEATSKALLDTVGADVLTNEELKREVTSRLVRPMLEQNFDNIQAEANRVQKTIDESDGIGLNGVNAAFPEDRAAGLVDKVNDSGSVEEAQSYLGEPVVNFHMHGYDSWVQANAKFRADAGMESKIIRRGHFGMCAWCAALAGAFEYGGDDMPKDVFRRHQYCKCVVLFTSERGKVRDVHSKVEYSAIRDARVARIRQLNQQRKASAEELEARKNLHKEIVRLNPESLQKMKEGLEKHSAYQYNADGTIIVTDDWTDREGAHIPGQYKPYAVIDTVSQRGTQRDRTFFDEKGWQVKQISNGPHGNPKRHPYGEHGEHAHDIIWREDNTQSRAPRNLTDDERKENADIL